jgi:hypothetical protein
MSRASLLLAAALVAAVPVTSRAQPTLPPVDVVDAGQLRGHVERLLRAFGELKAPLPAESRQALRALLDEKPADADEWAARVQKVLDAHCLVGVSINPESRVKAARGPAPAELRLDRETVVLVKVHNDAGVTHALTVSGPQLRSAGQAEGGRWLDVVVHARPPLAATLGGHRLEYVVVGLTAREAGKREATLKFDVGQGTQDLGFRAEVPVLFTVRP